MTARIEIAARRPSIRLPALFSVTASAVEAGTPASESCASRSASDVNGIPAASSVSAWLAKPSGTAGLFWMPVKNEAVSAEIENRTRQRRPDRGAELRAGVLQPTHLAALLVGNRRDGDAAELRSEGLQGPHRRAATAR